MIIPLFIGASELILIVALVLLLFGGKKLPEMMRGLGQGVKAFKEGMKDITEESPAEQQATTQQIQKDQQGETNSAQTEASNTVVKKQTMSSDGHEETV